MNPLLSILFTLFSFHFSLSSAKSPSPPKESFASDNFTRCVAPNSRSNNVIYVKNSPSYSSILQSSVQNLRFETSKTPQPRYIITPRTHSLVRVAIRCSKNFNFEVRIRSGGHDYEGLSYTSQKPFVIIDLANLRKITINAEDETAWVEAGATLGELYYQVAKKDNTLGFPAGVCPTIGVGGHISGGGKGTLQRKYGLSADNVIDAVLVDVNGKTLDRKDMGEDLFWAIRGGGAASFGVVISWKIKLVRVPPKVTVFTISKKLEEGATKLVYKWQNVADKLHRDLFIRLIVKAGENAQEEKTVEAEFKGLFLGRITRLLPLINASFPELDLKEKNCREMSWLESILYFDNSKNESTDLLLERNYTGKAFFKAKSDFVTDPISESELEEIWDKFLSPSKGVMIWDPSGAKMSEIPENNSPFPHRAGNLFSIQYFTTWEDKRSKVAKRHMDWIKNLYSFMGPFVSQNPRAAYLNYRDLDLGKNENGKESYSAAAESWGRIYFKNNFERLAQIKTVVDPENFFNYEQSIPLI